VPVSIRGDNIGSSLRAPPAYHTNRTIRGERAEM
jgi:hypothetical protein